MLNNIFSPQDVPILMRWGVSGLAFALLLLGHALGDFIFQTDRLVAAKRKSLPALLLHGLLVFFAHLITFIPFLTVAVLGNLALLSVGHVLIDRIKIGLDKKWDRPASWFLLDQFLHLSTLAVFLIFNHGVLRLNLEDLGVEWKQVQESVIPLSVLGAALAFNGRGAGYLIGCLLKGKEPQAQQIKSAGNSDESTAASSNREIHPQLGRLIGVLERLLLILLLVGGEWGAAGFVLAAKSIARYKELEQRAFSEYYLVGTLASFLCAVLSAMLVRHLAFA